jgi:CRISPR/Cas system-associated exonuclease Cas4 (RecB family)
VLEVSNSSISLYRTCQKKYYFHYVLGLTPRKANAGFILGGTIHTAFDKYYKGEDFKAIVNFIDATYKTAMTTLPPEEQEQCYLDSKTALGMFLNFPFKQLTFDKIESEREFKLPLMKDVLFVGRVDGKVTDKGHKWIREVKTTGEVKSAFENKSRVSSQATGYVWGISQVDNEHIVGVLYDGLRKPRLIKKVTEDMYEFGQRIYLDYCDEKKKESYFYRYPTYRTPTDVELWLEDTKSTVKSIQRSWKKMDFPRNTGGCFVFNKECEYMRVCGDRCPDPMVVDLLYEKKEKVNGNTSTEGDDAGEVSGRVSGNETMPR